jgi:hypothetical protein
MATNKQQHDKAELYESLVALNRNTSEAWDNIGWLAGLLSERDSMVALLAKLEEVRYWVNYDVLGDSSRLG